MKKYKTFPLVLFLAVGMTACSTLVSNVANEIEVDGNAVQSMNSDLQDDIPAAEGQIGEAVITDPVTPNETQEDYLWDVASEISVVLSDAGIQSDSASVEVAGAAATITSEGNYVVSGSLSDGQIVVDTDDDGIVRLILNNIDVHNEDGCAIFVADAAKVMIYLPEGSQNVLSDGASYNLPDSESDEPNATLFSTADLTIDGTGSLTVQAAYNDGISSKDGLIINDGQITITAVDDGLRGKDYIVFRNANLSVSAGGDGMKSDETDDTSKGYISIESGRIVIDAAMDAVDAETSVTILGGEFTLTAGGGSRGASYSDVSMKGLKGLGSVVIYGGSFTINTADDAIHSNGDITIFDGTFVIASGDDGIHADTQLTIENGKITISNSYEGLESAVITINNGEISIVSSDDGVNLAGGADGSGINPDMGGRPGRNTGPGFDAFGDSGNYYLYIHGGIIVINADGDGIDSNGSIAITAGTVIVNGPTENMNGALDYMGDFSMTGGVLIAVGSAGMAQSPAASSTQAAVLVNFNGQMAAGTPIHVENSAKEAIFTFVPAKAIQSIVFSTPTLEIGESYTIYVGGNTSAASETGLILDDGGYSGGSVYTTVALSSVITQVGGGGGFRR